MVRDEVCRILVDILGLDGSRVDLNENTLLLGGLPEFDSMAVVGVLTALEEHYGILIEDDEVDASLFETVGSLVRFVEDKAGA